MVLTMGRERLSRTSSSKTASSAAESELPCWITGFRCLDVLGEGVRLDRHSWAFIQLVLPLSVLISPLWASTRNGWASDQVGKVLVE